MVDTSPELPEGFRIRRLQLTDRDRLRLYMMPNDPRYVLAAVPIKAMIILYKIGHGTALALIPGIVLYFVIVVTVVISGLPINWLWIGISCFTLLGICIRFAFTLREDWLQFCWVVEQQERFVAYGVLRPYSGYSVLEWLQVHPKWARRGIGSTLVKTMLDQSPKPVYVDSAVRAMKFYTRLGFHKIHFKELSPDAQKHFSLRGIATLLVYEEIHD
ncbi:GNAT family N-acetyltransferase [Kovacikia minuta CCNUW1]|uniref:GNAT family N-acetyltransferase n=1 Tax=Kovacikia minuta TaxID=2931930 RepID=UPI001CC94286|nr:GNAT family N-acetyltransferase [Kovacikia minuta]UBF28681.1 GNAT family N-acetyltransferase [Kovacikia minuta CCNUW1]